MHNAIEPLLGVAIVGGLIGLLLSALTFIFWIWMLVDAIRNPRLEGGQRVVWVLVIIFLPCLGSLIYYFAGRSG